jgi:hypothetical protein
MYLYLDVGVMRKKLARSMPYNLALGIKVVELMRSLEVTRSAVGVLLLPAYVILLPPTVSRVQCGLSF